MLYNFYQLENSKDEIDYAVTDILENKQITNSTPVQEIHVPNFKANEEGFVLFFDQSTTSTGVSLYTAETGLLVGAGFVKRGKFEDKDKFRIALKNFVLKCCLTQPVKALYYEEVYGGNSYGASEDLNQLKTIFKDIKNEYCNGLLVEPVNNKKWKKRFLHPEKVSRMGTAAEKAQIKTRCLRDFPVLATLKLPQDTFDAVGIGEAVFNVKLKRIPESLCRDKIKTNKYRQVEVEVSFFEHEDQVHVKDPKLAMYGQVHGIKYREFDTNYTLEENIKIAIDKLAEEDEKQGTRESKKLMLFAIPEHTGTGEICLKYNCPYKKNQLMVAFGKYKSSK